MGRRDRILALTLTALLCGFAFLAAALQASTLVLSQKNNGKQAQGAAAQSLPHYYNHPPRGPLPATLPWEQFAGNPVIENTYFFGARIRGALYQMPCFCYCDKSLGHGSLLDCIVKPDKHAAVCPLCQKEILFTYREVQAGKSPVEIRKDIIDGKWENLDMTQYETPPRP